MDTAWTHNGHRMDTALTHNGHGMDTAWTHNGYGMDIVRIHNGHGLYNVHGMVAWIRHGHCMDNNRCIGRQPRHLFAKVSQLHVVKFEVCLTRVPTSLSPSLPCDDAVVHIKGSSRYREIPRDTTRGRVQDGCQKAGSQSVDTTGGHVGISSDDFWM